MHGPKTALPSPPPPMRSLSLPRKCRSWKLSRMFVSPSPNSAPHFINNIPPTHFPYSHSLLPGSMLTSTLNSIPQIRPLHPQHLPMLHPTITPIPPPPLPFPHVPNKLPHRILLRRIPLPSRLPYTSHSRRHDNRLHQPPRGTHHPIPAILPLHLLPPLHPHLLHPPSRPQPRHLPGVQEGDLPILPWPSGPRPQLGRVSTEPILCRFPAAQQQC